MNSKIVFIMLLLSIQSSFVFCQMNCGNQYKVKELDKTRNYLIDTAYIVHNSHSNTDDDISVYLINNSDSTIQAQGYNGQIEFEIEALGRDSVWQRIDYKQDRWCGTEYGEFCIPPNHYTSEKVYTHNIKGNYETSLRFFYAYDKDTIRSEPTMVSIDSVLLSSTYDKIIRYIDRLLAKTTDSTNIHKLTTYKVKHFLATDQLEEAKLAISELTTEGYQDYDTKHLTAKYYARLLKKYQGQLSKGETIAIVCKMIQLWNVMPKSNFNYKAAERSINIYSKLLVESNKWDEINDLDCIIEDGNYRCYVGHFIEDYISIIFK